MTRHIDFEGVENFRDFGGYDTACGRGLKRGLLYRSANHSRATDADLEAMRALGLAVIVDLRRPVERERDPSRRWDGFGATVIENDILDDRPDWVEAVRGSDLSARWFFEDSLAFYRIAAHEPRHVDLFARYFRALAEVEGPLVVHCAAGKDRTGLICALTHHVAGVHPDDAMADFLLTNDEDRMSRRAAAVGAWIAENVGRPISDEALRVAMSVHPAYMQAALEAMTSAHGSVDAYLREALGVDAALRRKIEARILG